MNEDVAVMIIIAVMSGVVLGLALGGLMMKVKWQQNASSFLRTESGGKLYKVVEGDFYMDEWIGKYSKYISDKEKHDKRK